MALEGPSLRYVRADENDVDLGSAHSRALRLAREIEELLEGAPTSEADSARTVHSSRMARAMAASLIDELEALCRSVRSARAPAAVPRKTGSA